MATPRVAGGSTNNDPGTFLERSSAVLSEGGHWPREMGEELLLRHPPTRSHLKLLLAASATRLRHRQLLAGRNTDTHTVLVGEQNGGTRTRQHRRFSCRLHRNRNI